MLSVAIAVEVPGDMDDVAPIVSASCEATAGAGRCPLARSIGPASIVAWYALVRSDDPTATHLWVELRDRSAAGALIETRELAFSEYDDARSRWASVGTVIAAFVAARDSSERAAPRTVELEKPAPRAPEAPSPRWGVDLLAVSGPALDRGPLRWGGALRGFGGLPGTTVFIGSASLRYTQRSGELDLAWVSAAAGVGARHGDASSRFTFDLTGELVYERLSLTGRNAATGHEAHSRQDRFGGRVGARAAVRAWAAGLAFVLGADVSALRPSVDITLADVPAGREPALGYTLVAGVRFGR